jgi:hypothetical protein
VNDFDILSAAGPLAPFLIDPNSTLGLRWEGARGRAAGKAVTDNPYTSWCAGSLAESHWWEGWFLEGQRAEGKRSPDLKAAETFARQQKATRSALGASPSGRQLGPGTNTSILQDPTL